MPNPTGAGARASPALAASDGPIAEAQQHLLHEAMEAYLPNSTNDLNQHVSRTKDQSRLLLQFIEERLNTTPDRTSLAVLCVLHDELHTLLDHIHEIVRDSQFPSLTRAVSGPRVSVAEALGPFLSPGTNPAPAVEPKPSRKKKSRR